MQVFEQKENQTVISNKGLASMGYGLAGAIGACFGGNLHDVILIEGDGGFAQNSQELATVARNNLPLKMIIFENGGYASIRMTQKNYFAGSFLGCDEQSGLGMPNWYKLFEAYGIPVFPFDVEGIHSEQIARFLDTDGPQALLVPIHPEQTYFPKIASRVEDSGNMKSNPLHLMTPKLDASTAASVFKYF
jgi:acetolactate synthase-1/2/3 large subunit